MRASFACARSMMASFVIAAAIVSASGPTFAQETAAISIAVKGRQFHPAEIHAPANERLAIRVKNSGCRSNRVRERLASG